MPPAQRAIGLEAEPGPGDLHRQSSGVSGAGKKPAPGFHYPERYENASAYPLSGHQHVMEIERELTELAGAGGWVGLGFRYATSAEICGLFSNYAGPFTLSESECRL